MRLALLGQSIGLMLRSARSAHLRHQLQSVSDARPAIHLRISTTTQNHVRYAHQPLPITSPPRDVNALLRLLLLLMAHLAQLAQSAPS